MEIGNMIFSIQNMVLRSCMEYADLANLFLCNIKKEYITEEFQIVYDKIKEAVYSIEKIPFGVYYFAKVVPEPLMLEILRHSPTRDIEPFF